MLYGQGGYAERIAEYPPHTQPFRFSYFGLRVLGHLLGFDTWALMEHLDKCILG